MHLLIKREQKENRDRKDRIKGIDYVVTYQLKATEEEQASIDRHGLSRTYVVGDHSSPYRQTIADLLEGGSFSEATTQLALQRQEIVAKGARNAAALLSQIEAFDGRETIVELNSESTD